MIRPRKPTQAALVLASIFLLVACQSESPSQPPAPPPAEVGVINVQPQSLPLTRDAVGRLSAFRIADVRARVPGVLIKRAYEEGTDVEQGQLLFQIDPKPLQAALNQAEAQRAQARATLVNNQKFAERARELAPQGYISASALDDAEAAERTARAAVQQAEAEVEAAQIDLGYTDVRAPIDGRADRQQVTEGALVGQNEATLLTTVSQIEPLYVTFALGVREMNDLREAQSLGNATLFEQGQGKVQLKTPEGRSYGEPGTLTFSGTAVDPDTGEITLRATIPNSDRTLLPGMYANLRATLGELREVFTVPQSAVLRDDQGAYVLGVDADNTVQRVGITTFGSSDGSWVVTEGLQPGQQVIVSGIPKSTVGQPVKPEPVSADVDTD